MKNFLKSCLWLFALLVAMPMSHAAECVEGSTFAWDAATPPANQTIDGTEILVDGAVVGSTAADTYPCADLMLDPGAYTMTVRHFGTVDGLPATSADSNPLAFTIAQQQGVPGVAPDLRFHQLDGTA